MQTNFSTPATVAHRLGDLLEGMTISEDERELYSIVMENFINGEEDVAALYDRVILLSRYSTPERQQSLTTLCTILQG